MEVFKDEKQTIYTITNWSVCVWSFQHGAKRLNLNNLGLGRMLLL